MNEKIRPQVFSEDTYHCLDELRAFRHIFRSAYSVTLDPERVALVLRRAKELQALYLADLVVFKRFLKSL